MTVTTKRTGSLAIPLLALAIVALLVAGVTGVAIHHPSSPKAAATPSGYQRLMDTTDHISLAVPGGWQSLRVTAGQIGSDLATLKAREPQLAPLLDLALSGLQRVQPGVFALDVATRTSLFTYGLTQPGVTRLSDIRPEDGVAALRNAGAKNVAATKVHLRLGDAEQLSAQVTVGADTVTELLDYFVWHQRVVAIIVAVRSAEAPTSLFHQIEATVTASP